MKYTENMITENVDIRNELINRVDVLNKVKKVLTLPHTEVMTMQQVADFYEVPLNTIESCYNRNKNEIDMDGVVVMTPKTYKEFLKTSGKSLKNGYTQLNGRMVVHIDDNTDVIIPNRGVKVFPENAILRVGMLLTESPIALEVRTQLINVLNVVKEVQPELVTREIDKEEALYLDIVKNIISGNRENVLVAFQNVVDYHKRHVLEMEKKIDEIETANQELETANQVITSNLKVISDRSSLSRVIRCLARVKSKSYSQAWNEFYTFLNYKAHINLKKRGGKPYVNHINDNEWDTIQQVLVGYIEKNGLNATEFLKSCEIVK